MFAIRSGLAASTSLSDLGAFAKRTVSENLTKAAISFKKTSYESSFFFAMSNEKIAEKAGSSGFVGLIIQPTMFLVYEDDKVAA